MSARILVRHTLKCASREGRKCNCRPGYQANVWSQRDGKRMRKTFTTLAAARAWRAEAQVAIGSGKLRAPLATTVHAAAEELIAGMRSGRVRTRSGDVYKPSVIRGYERELRERVVPAVGGKRLGELQRRDVQRFADDLLGQGLDPSTVRNVLMPLRVIVRRAIEDGDLAVNPTAHLRLRRSEADESGSRRRKKRGVSSKLSRNETARFGRRLSTPACAAAS